MRTLRSEVLPSSRGGFHVAFMLPPSKGTRTSEADGWAFCNETTCNVRRRVKCLRCEIRARECRGKQGLRLHSQRLSWFGEGNASSN